MRAIPHELGGQSLADFRGGGSGPHDWWSCPRSHRSGLSSRFWWFWPWSRQSPQTFGCGSGDAQKQPGLWSKCWSSLSRHLTGRDILLALWSTISIVAQGRQKVACFAFPRRMGVSKTYPYKSAWPLPLSEWSVNFPQSWQVWSRPLNCWSSRTCWFLYIHTDRVYTQISFAWAAWRFVPVPRSLSQRWRALMPASH